MKEYQRSPFMDDLSHFQGNGFWGECSMWQNAVGPDITAIMGSAKKPHKRSLLAGISLLPILAACDTKQVDLDSGKLAPVEADTKNLINDYDNTYNPDETKNIQLGSDGEDTVIGGLLPRDHGNSKLSSEYGGGDDKIIGLGVSEASQYTEADLKNTAGTDTDFSKILYLDQVYQGNEIFTTINANRLSTIVSGDTINGGAGNDSLFLYGQHHFYRLERANETNHFTGENYEVFSEKSVELKGIENIYVHAGTLLVSGKFIRDLPKGIKIQGDGRAILWIKTPVDVSASNEAGRFIGRKYESSSEGESYKRFQISDIDELKNYIVDLRTLDIQGFDRLHIEAGTAVVLRLGVETEQGIGTVEGILKGLSMITGKGAIVFEGTGNVNVPNLENLWISREIEVLIAGRTQSSLAERDGSRGGSKEIDDDNLSDTEVNGKTFLKLGLNVHGSAEDDIMDATKGNDELFGGAGNDTLNGDEGDDMFSPGIGRDQIITGAGKDIIIGEGGALDRDTILDLSYNDKIKILGAMDITKVSAKIVDGGGERRIEIDTDGDGELNFYMVLAKPTAEENSLSGDNRVYNNVDTHFQVVADTGGILLIPSKLKDIVRNGEDVNRAPEAGLIFIEGPLAIKENEVGSLVARIRAIDADSPASGNGRHGFRLIEDNQGYYKKFVISSSGELRLRGDASFDFEQVRLINIFVEVFDNPSATGEKTADSLSRQQTIKIAIEDVNEAPIFETFNDKNTTVGSGGSVDDDGTLVTVSVRENTTFVMKFPKATDSDLGDATSYRLEGRNSDLFTFDPLTQTIRFKEAANYEAQPGDSYLIRLIASDANGLTSSKEIAVTVEDVNEAPVATNPLPVQWAILGDNALGDGAYSEILGIEDIFQDPEYEELRRLENESSSTEISPKTLTYRYQDKATGGTLSWLSQPSQVGTDRYGMEIDKAQLESLYGNDKNLYLEFEIEIFAKDQSGLEGKSTFKLIVTLNKPPVVKDGTVATAEYLTENGDLNQRVVENGEAFKFLDGVTDPEGKAIKIRTTIPMVDNNGNMLTDANGNELYQQIYWGKYGYFVLQDVDLTLSRAGGKNPNSQQYSYYLISDPDDITRAKQFLDQIKESIAKRRAREAELNISEEDSRLKNFDESVVNVGDAFLQGIFDEVNSLSESERSNEEIDIDIEDYGLEGDRKSPSSFVKKTVTLEIDGTNDAPTKQGELSITVREPGDAFTAPETGDDPSATASGGIGSLMENVRDVDTRDELRAGAGSIPQQGIGVLEAQSDGSYRFVANHDESTPTNPSAVDSLSEGEILTRKFLVQVDDGNGGAVTNEILVNIVGRNDAPVFDQEIFDAGTYGASDFTKLRFSQDSVHEFDLPSGSFSDVDEKDELTYSYVARRGVAETTGGALTYEIVDISNWFAIDPNTGRVQIDRPPSPVGGNDETRYEITITASDGRATVDGELRFTVYKNSPPFNVIGTKGFSEATPFSIPDKEVVDLTPQEVRNIVSPVNPTKKHIAEGDAYELLGGGIEDITELAEGNIIRVEANDPSDEKFNNLDIVAGTYSGKYGTLVISAKVGGVQTYTYTLDYDAPLTKQLKHDVWATGSNAEAIEIKVKDKGGLIGSQWISIAVRGINNAPDSAGEQVYVVSENIGNDAIRVNPLNNVSDPDGDVDTSPDQDTLYIWSVASTETGEKKDFNELITLKSGTTNPYEISPITVTIKGRYGELQIFRKVTENGEVSYDSRYIVDRNSIEVEKLSTNDSLSEVFTLTVGDGVLPTQPNAYGTEQVFRVQISGENDTAVITPVPELTIASDTSYEMDLNAYVEDPDSTKIYRIKSVTKDGVLISNYSFLSRAGEFQGTIATLDTLNELTFNPVTADIGTYRFTFTTSDVSAPNTVLEGEEILLRLNVVAPVTPVSFPSELDLTGSGAVIENNQLLTTAKTISYPVNQEGSYRPAEGRYKGKYGYIEVIRGDVAANDSITYYLDNLDPDTDALSDGENVIEEILLDLELTKSTGRPREQQTIKISVGGTNDAPVVQQSLTVRVNLASGETFADITQEKMSATIADPEPGNLTFEFDGSTDDNGRIQGKYGYIEKLNNGNYRYVVDPFSDTNPLRVREVKGLEQGETATETFKIKVSDAAGSEVAQTLTVTVIGNDDPPEIIKADADNNIIIRFLQGISAEKALTGDYVIDPDGDEIQYRQIGNVERDGRVINDNSVRFDAATGRVLITEDAIAGTYTVRTLIQNPFELPISADGNAIKIIVSNVTSDNLSLVDEPLTTVNGDPLQVIEGTDDTESLPLEIEGRYLTETKENANGFNPKPVAVNNVQSTYGTYSIDEFTGNFIYKLDNTNQTVNGLDRSDKLEDTISYEVVDDYGTRDTREIVITIIGSNDSSNLEIKNLQVEGFELEQKKNTVSDDVAYESLFGTTQINLADPESGNSFDAAVLTVSVKGDSNFADNFKFAFVSNIVEVGGKIELKSTVDSSITLGGVLYTVVRGSQIKFEFKNGATNVDIENLLKTLEFHLDSTFAVDVNGALENGGGYRTTGTFARFEGLTVDVDLTEGGESSNVRLLDKQGEELRDQAGGMVSGIPLTVKLHGFNRHTFANVNNFNRDVTPLGLVVAFDGYDNNKNNFKFENVSGESNPFEIVSVDDDGDGVPDRFVLRSKDIGGTEYIVRELASGEVLGAGATKFTVIWGAIADGVSDSRHIKVIYDPLPDNSIITSPEIDAQGNLLSEAEQANDVKDLQRPEGASSLSNLRIFTGGGDDNLYDNHDDLASDLAGLFAESNTIYSGAGNDRIFSGGGNDQLYGGSGNDLLRGGRGSDDLIGGRGSDTYEWVTSDADPSLHDIMALPAGGGTEISKDRIIGYSVTESDVIDLKKVAFKDSSGNDLTGLGTVLAGQEYIRIEPGKDGVPTKILLDINGDGTFDQEISLWQGEIGKALGDTLDATKLQPDLLVPAFGTNIELPDVFAYAVLNLTSAASNNERLIAQTINARVEITGNFTLGNAGALKLEFLGEDKDLFVEEAGNIAGNIIFDRVATAEYVRESYLLSVKATHKTTTGATVTAFGTKEIKLTGFPDNYEIKTGGADKVLAPGTALDITAPLNYLLFEGDDLFGTAYLGNHRGINAINIVYAGAGSDIVYTGDGNDEVYGGSGNDTIWSGLGDDTVEGGIGDDVLVLTGGANIVDGGVGDDAIWLSSSLWQRNGDEEEISTTATSIDEIEVTLGAGRDRLFLQRDGAIKIELQDNSFESGDIIDLSHYVVLPKMGSAVLHVSSYVSIKAVVGGMVMYIDREGLGHFAEPTAAGGGFEADTVIKFNGSIQDGEIRDAAGNDINLQFSFGNARNYDLNDALENTTPTVVSARLRSEGGNDYGLFLSFDEGVEFGRIGDWKWQMNLRSSDDSLLRALEHSSSDVGKFVKPESADNVPAGMDYTKTLYWSFNRDIGSVASVKLDILELSKGNINFDTVNNFRVHFDSAAEPSIDFPLDNRKLIWKLDATDNSKNEAAPTWEIAATILEDQGYQRYEILGQYSYLFQYESGELKRSGEAFDVSRLDEMPRELHLTLVAFNERGAEKRADFIIERELPPVASSFFDEETEGISPLGVDTDSSADGF